MSFDVPQNSFTAIVGPSGAGKTTIFSLIERYYKPKLGKILVNGKLLEDYSVEEWRKEIGYASQDVPIIDATIRDNITYGLDDTIDDERLYQVAEEACLSDFIEKLPDKYDTYVGERGIKLSGGQKQRIGIARAILRNPKLLLLDEATSNLDSILEKRIQEAFGRVGNMFMTDEYAIESYSLIDVQFDAKIKDELLAKAIETLTDRKKEVIFLAYFQGMSDAAIARKLNLVRSTVCEHRTRSLELLKNTMEEYMCENNR